MASVPIPPTNSTSAQAGNPSAGSNNAPPNANTPPPSASQAPNASQQSSNIFSRLAKWSNGAFSFANGIGTFALIAAFVFGIGAWVGMKIQISQGGKNMDLAIWTACADHEAIQHTKLCKTILAKDFSEFQKREEEKTGAKEVTIVVKRGIDEQVPAGPDRINTLHVQPSRLEKLLSRVSSSDRSHIDVDAGSKGQPEAAFRAMIFPFVNLLVRPLSWVFEFIEYMFLVMIYCIHKIFSWTTTVVIFCVQAWIYSLVEGVFKQFLSVIDRLIFQLLPNWIPYLLVSDVASLLSLTALRSYWYSTRYLTSLKWILIFRMGIWLIVSAPRLCYKLCKEGQLRFEQRKSQWEPTETRFRPDWPSRRSSPSALDVGLPIPSPLPTSPTPPNLPVTSSQTSALPLAPSTCSVRSLAPPRKTDRGAEAHSEGNISPEELFYKQLKPRGRGKSPSLRNGISGSYLRPTVPSLG